MAETNVLKSGVPRVGWLYDGNPDTPHIGVTLLDTEQNGIQLSIPLRDLTGVYARWFQKGIFGIRNSDGSQVEPLAVPNVLQFHDSYGPVVLVGCRTSGWHTGFQVGSGQVNATYAVLGGTHLNYAKINGMRTVVPHLAHWMGARITRTDLRTDKRSRIIGLDVTTSAQRPLRVGRKGNLTFQGSFRTSSELGPDTTLIYDQMRVETHWKEPRPWHEHLDLHEGVIEVLTISAWRDFGFEQAAVSRDDDLLPTPSGPTPRWSEVATYNIPRPDDQLRRPSFLFTFQDIGVAGLRRWFALRSTYARAMRPFVRLRHLGQTGIEARLVQSSIALDALGYALADPAERNSRGQLEFNKALRAVYANLRFDALGDPEAWIREATAIYRMVKHADNPSPDVLDMANVHRDNIRVLRAWVALQLGMSHSVLRDRLSRDSQASATYEKSEW